MNRPTPTSSASRKRKRTPSSSTAAAATAAESFRNARGGTGSKVINPLSHTPSTVKQFKVAGLSIDAPLPSRIYPGFPHQPIPPPTGSGSGQQTQKREGRGQSSATSRWEHFYSSEVDVDGYYTDGTGYESGTSRFEEETGNDDETLADTGGDDAGQEERAIFTSAADPYSTGNDDEDEDDEREPGRRRRRRRNEQLQHQPQGRYNKKPRNARPPGTAAAERADAHKKHVGGLVQIIERGLMEGDISMAKRAFGLLVRTNVYGARVDLRYADYWKLGLDILLREGEEEDEQRRKRRRRRLMREKNRAAGGGNLDGQQLEEDFENFEDDEDEELEEGGYGYEDEEDEDEDEVEYKFARKKAANVLVKVKAYYETLIKLHQYNRARPTALSSLHLYPAMFRFELDDVRNEYDQGKQRLERIRRLGGFGDEGDDEDDDKDSQDPNHDQNYDHNPDHDQRRYGEHDDSMDVDTHGGHETDENHHSSSYSTRRSSSGDSLLRQKQREGRIIDRPADRLRRKALARLTDVAHRMDTDVLENLPFKKDYTLLSLRAEIALLMADLSVPCLLSRQTETGAATTTTTAITDTTTTTIADGGERPAHSSPSQQLLVESGSTADLDLLRQSLPPELQEEEEEEEEEEEPEPIIKYEFEQEERDEVAEGEVARVRNWVKALKVLTVMKKTVRKGGLLDTEDEVIWVKLREGLGDVVGPGTGTKSLSGNGSESGNESDNESGTGSEDDGEDGDDEAGGKNVGLDPDRKQRRRQKEKEKQRRKEARRGAVGSSSSSRVSVGGGGGKGIYSALPIR